MSITDPVNETWVASGHIALTAGETLVGLWVSTWGLHQGPDVIVNPDPAAAHSDLILQLRAVQLRLGLMWQDAPDVAIDPHSTLGDPLWVSSAQWQVTTVTPVWPHPLSEVAVQSRSRMISSHATPAAKVDGQRRVDEGTMYITFCGSETMIGHPFHAWRVGLGMHASVSALVMLPEGG